MECVSSARQPQPTTGVRCMNGRVVDCECEGACNKSKAQRAWRDWTGGDMQALTSMGEGVAAVTCCHFGTAIHSSAHSANSPHAALPPHSCLAPQAAESRADNIILAAGRHAAGPAEHPRTTTAERRVRCCIPASSSTLDSPAQKSSQSALQLVASSALYITFVR
jgi:hypothetical protein